jgi:hypothetical protein
MLNVPVSVLIADNISENFKHNFVINNPMMAINPTSEKLYMPMSEISQKIKSITVLV